MIGGHPDIITIPEAQFIADCIPDRGTAVSDLAEIVDNIANHWRFKIWGHDLGTRRQDVKGPGSYADAVRWLVRDYAKAHGRPQASLWVDHQPGHGQFLARLQKHFPDLHAIHVVRDGRAVAASLLPLDWGPNEIHSAAYFWEQRIGWCLAAAEYLGKDRMLLLKYEDVVREPEEAMRKVAGFLNIDFHPDMTKGIGLAVPAFTVEQHRLVGSMPNPSRIDDWKNKLTPRQIEIFEAITGDVLVYFGYELVSGSKPRAITLSEKITLTLRGQLKAVLHSRQFDRRKRAFAK